MCESNDSALEFISYNNSLDSLSELKCNFTELFYNPQSAIYNPQLEISNRVYYPQLGVFCVSYLVKIDGVGPADTHDM